MSNNDEALVLLRTLKLEMLAAEKRVSRIESKLTQLMMHLGADPEQRIYSEPRQVQLKLFPVDEPS